MILIERVHYVVLSKGVKYDSVIKSEKSIYLVNI